MNYTYSVTLSSSNIVFPPEVPYYNLEEANQLIHRRLYVERLDILPVSLKE